MSNDPSGRPVPSPIVTAAGVDHVRLAYDYLDSGDVDGYGSLLDDDIALDRPDAPPGRGRDQVVRMHADGLVPRARHHIDRIVADGHSVVATGHLSPVSGRHAHGPERIDFVDVFTLSAEGMLLGCRRYYFASPGLNF
ncbi:nuclear transport factor 2 family protein [Streptomyces sp. SL13]|uniref:Nuclear transport factor 2 family protein n=1 Tax=Streptantibioticus silvisoli TaxID=2705255 RepID=A0AA90GY80_9ACTN|nr:nuclear transport factor 2 family protein [Streptantibioticus silvisoli]MDI5967756.1 nuclear transport factor 2 family protein [Streptantibioticus silvisoli]